MSTPIPDPWKTSMEQKGISSIRDLARRSGVSVETVRRLVQGSRKAPKDETVRAVADALGQPLSTVAAWTGSVASDVDEPYVPPTEANRLTLRQREAVDEMIRLLALKDGLAESGVGPAPNVISMSNKRSNASGTTVQDRYDEIHDQLDRGELDAEPYAAGTGDDQDVEQPGPEDDEGR